MIRITKMFSVSAVKNVVPVSSPLPVPTVASIVPVPTSAPTPIPLVVIPNRDRDLDGTPPPVPAAVLPGSTFIPPELMRQLFDPNKQEYVCPFCLWTTPDEEKVQGHIASHTGEPVKDRNSKRYNCRFCPFASKQKGNLLRHERIHTGEKPYACDLCDYKSHRGDKITAHKLTIHKVAAPAVQPNSPLNSSLSLLAMAQFNANNNHDSDSTQNSHHQSPPAII
ncbi:B-cell lymphoma/leukemia 11B-like isoform X1 [Varroa jacobsoni]|uniref:B-cell lymphoma/leukemia 11B-like isoform X1 n=1 Tax=Varroa jacobsoni TaxID=62625 RepID=UPI000BF6DC89|nr:B-cell lymphoma/leukemia 11B-like isoform X1 [Varroa jacobsoni]